MTDRITRALCLLLPILAGGCAVATIDVDVYKGPLTNHRDVQTEQLAAMAAGAKPLLTELRNRLEWPLDQAEAGGSFRKVSGYSDNYMPGGVGHYVFIESRASRVNEILSLYVDRTDPRLTALLNEGQSALEQYRHAYQVFRESGVSEKVVWEDLRSAMRPGLDKAAATPKGINDLWHGYNMLSQRTGRYERTAQYEQWIIKGHVEFVSHATTDSTLKLLASWNMNDKLYRAVGTAENVAHEAENIDPREEEIIPANAAFELLADRQFVAAHAEVLFPADQERAKQTFVAYVTQVGESFIAAREALARMGHVTLELIAYVNSADASRNGRKEEITRNLANNVMEYYPPQHLFEVLLAAEMPGGTVPSAVTELGRVLRKGHEKTFTDYAAALKSLNAAHVAKQPEKESDAKSLRDLGHELASIVKNELERNPLATVDQILRADQFYREIKGEPARRDSFAFYDQPSSARKYGLANGPVVAQLDPVEVTKDWQSSTEFLGSAGLASGRLDAGLNSLIETYLRVSFDGTLDAQNHKVIAERERLLTGLAQFAEKILFMANNQALLGGNDDSSATGQTTRKYALLLQSVGNSILVQVDELRKAASYDRDAVAAGPREAAALREAFYDDPATAIDRMINDLEDEYDRTKQANADHAGRIANALTVIRSRRAEVKQSFSADPPATARVARRRLRQLLAAKPKSEVAMNAKVPPTDPVDPPSNDGASKLVTDAVAIIGEYETTLLARPAIGEGGDSRTVLDQLIKALQYERIKAASEGGSDSARATHLKNAIDLAYTYRSGMIYLRPASSFLKNSYPATSLQPDAKLAWENTLEHHAWRSGTPFIPTWYAKYDESNRTAAEIDKQFWQNVNTVRVAGGGDTNYVIAKDDIGNWYVKAYANNMKDIIEATGNLTTFAMSPAAAALMSKNVAALATKAGTAASKTASGNSKNLVQASNPAPASDPTTQPSAADLQLTSEAKKYADAYNTASAADYKAIADFARPPAANTNSAGAPKPDAAGAAAPGAAAAGAAAPSTPTAPAASDPLLKKAILSAWKSHIKQDSDIVLLQHELDNAYAVYVQDAVAEKLDAATDPGPQFAKALGALRDFNNGLKLQLAQVAGLSDSNLAAAASRDLTSVMQAQFVPLLDRRKKTVAGYTTQLGVLNDLSAQ
ncbi:MAG: hypothetical protein JWN51_3361 [Phycisphaerales bacterium]|nr:hypothetical protein [Phycisphaerales bacterium]